MENGKERNRAAVRKSGMEGEEGTAAPSPNNSTDGRQRRHHRHLFNNYNSWKHKLRENCYQRVREDRRRLLWKMRTLPAPQSLNPIANDYIKSAFQDIVSAELGKMDSTLNDSICISAPLPGEANDVLWEYDGLTDAYQGDCEEILLEMQRIFYQDLSAEPTTKETQILVETWEDEEDEYLAQAVYEHMQLKDKQLQIWCPICKHGELQENHHLIYCNSCDFQLNKGDEVNLELLRGRLEEVHGQHLDRGCRLTPTFCIETRFNITALYILCGGCNTFEVVL